MNFVSTISLMFFSLFGYADNNLSISLMKASAEGNLTEVKSLLAQGADIEFINPDPQEGINALHAACAEDRLDIVQCLIEHHANIEAKVVSDDSAFNGMTPLHVACAAGNKDIVKYLIEQGADVNVKTESDLTPLDVAYRFFGASHPEVVKILLSCDAVAQALTMDDLFDACNMGHLEIVEYFIMKYPDAINISIEDGWTPLHQACQTGAFEVVELLVSNGADIESRDVDGATPLFTACMCGNFNVVKYLIEHGAAVNDSDNCGNTPYGAAYENGYWHIVEYLAEHGAEVFTKN